MIRASKYFKNRSGSPNCRHAAPQHLFSTIACSLTIAVKAQLFASPDLVVSQMPLKLVFFCNAKLGGPLSLKNSLYRPSNGKASHIFIVRLQLRDQWQGMTPWC